MQNLLNINILYFIIPFFAVLVGAWLLDLLPKNSIFRKFMDIITEKKLSKLLLQNGFKNTTVKTYQRLRIVVAIVIALIVLLSKKVTFESAIGAILVLIAAYKFFYIYLLYLDYARIRKLSQQLPYMMKSLIYLMYSFNVTTSIKKVVENVNTVFKYDLKLLLDDIQDDPNSYQPYQNFIDRYDGKIKNLDVYLKLLYRITDSGTTEESKRLMSNLNDTISSEVQAARKQANDSTNMAIGYLGMIPVFLSAFMVIVMMIISIGAF